MKRLKVKLVMCLVVGLVMIWWLPAFAASYDFGGQEVIMDGFFRQEVAYNPNSNSPNNYRGIQSADSMLYTDISTTFGRNLEVRGIFRLWGDLAYGINRGDSQWDKFFGPSDDKLEFFDDFTEIVREAYVTYTSDRFQIRVGRQQIGWGEADGLRVMDVINPLDLRRGPFYDTQGYSQVRIPKWLVKTELYPDSVGPISDIALQLIWNPGDVQEQQQLQLPHYVDAHILGMNTMLGANSPYYGEDAVAIPNNAGTWGVPTPNYHLVPFEFNFKKRTDSLDNNEFGARLACNVDGTFMTFNFWHGWGHEALFDFQSLGYHARGNPLPVGVAGVAPDGSLIPQIVPVAVYADFYYPRVTYSGMTANREIEWFSKLLGINTNPVLRFEGLYSFNQQLQSTRTPTVPHPFLGSAPTDIFMIHESDQIRGMIGFDWPIRVPFINAKKNVFVSGQYFHIYTVEMPGGYDSGLFPGSEFRKSDITLDGSPYKTLVLNRNQSYCTLLLNTAYLNETIIPSVLYVQDLRRGSRWVKSELLFKLGDHWRPSIRYLYVDGGYQDSAFSVYRDRDEIALQVEYQF